MRIQFIPADLDGPGSYRCIFPARVLRELGHEVTLPKMRPLEVEGRRFFPFNMPRFDEADVFVIHRKADHAWIKWVVDAKRAGKTVVASTDDDDLNLPDWHPAAQAKDGSQNRKFWHTVVRAADALIVSTPALADSYAALNPNITVIPNYLDRKMWEHKPVRDWQGVRVGWLGNPSMRSGDLAVIRPVLGGWLRRHPDVSFVAAGGELTHDILGIPDGQRVSIPQIDFMERRLHEMLRFDIGLVPLEMNLFNESKSALKGMEYAAVGIPAVASPTESYRSWHASGGGVLLAQEPGDWAACLDVLLDESLRLELGGRASDHVEQHWIQDHAEEWEEFFFDLKPPHWMSERAWRKHAVQKPVELEGFLEELRNREPRVVVEIGTASGGTFHGLCLAAPDDATIVSIDLPGADGFDYSGPATFDRLRALAKPGQDIHFLREDSHAPETRAKLEQILAGRGIDVLFIDGDHSYEGVKADFELYSPLVSGLVGFHDIVEHTDVPCDVDRFWNEIKGRYEHREHVDRRFGNWGGIGVLDLQEALVRAA